MTREQIITDMCLTFNHAYFLEAKPEDSNDVINCAMTQKEKDFLWRQMAQLYDNCIHPRIFTSTNERELGDAYRNWQSTGELSGDPNIVKALHDKFRTIADESVVISEYHLMTVDATKNMHRLMDIMKARGIDHQ